MKRLHEKGIAACLLFIFLVSPAWANKPLRFIDQLHSADISAPYSRKISDQLWETIAKEMAELPQLRVSKFDRRFTFDKVIQKKIRLFQKEGRTKIVDYYPPADQGIVSCRINLDRDSVGGLVLAKSTRDYRIIALGRKNYNFLLLGRVEKNFCRWDYFGLVPQTKEKTNFELTVVFRGSDLQVYVNGEIAYITAARPEDEIYRIGTVELVNDQEISGVEISKIRHRKMVEDEFNDVSFLIWAHLQNLLKNDRADEYESDLTRELVFRPGIGKENRTALLFSPSAKITFPVEIPAEAVLDFGLGAQSLGSEGKRLGDETSSLQVDLIDENDQEITLFSQTAEGNLTEQWQDIRLDLSPYAGFRGRISWSWKMEPDAIPQKVLFLANPTLISPPSPGKKTPNVILYLVDSLRADRLGCYGNPANITPEIDRWAQNKIQFEACYTQAPWALPALTSLFTASYPYTHKAFFLGDRSDLPTLAEMLRKKGYTTSSFSENIVTGQLSGLDRGFDLLDFNTVDTDRLQEWIKKNRFHPFFLYIHIQNPHLRYWPPREFLPEGITTQEVKKINREYMKLTYYQSFSNNLDDLMNTRNLLQEKLGKALPDIRKLYDGEVATADYRFGRLVRMLKKFNLEDETLIILTSNHGEEFAEHGELLHGRSLYNTALHVPLILHLPGPVRHGMSINEPVGLLDILPTIIDILGQKRTSTQGTSLLPMILGSPGKQERKIFAVRNSFKMFSADRGKKNVSMIDERWKAIYNQDPDTMELYDNIADPEERHNLASDYPIQTQAYKEMILLWLEEQQATNQQSSINKWLDSVWR